MLIRNAVLERIKRGEITLQFRRWHRPTVKPGGTLLTAIGMLSIHRVDLIESKDITTADVRQAGYPYKTALLEELDSRDGEIYRIVLSFAGEDPRIALRESDQLTLTELEEIHDRLRRFDAHSRHGSWTLPVMVAIQQHPRVPAGELAQQLGFHKQWMKTNIRKLKALGITISHHPGYELSPRGVKVLEHLQRQG